MKYGVVKFVAKFGEFHNKSTFPKIDFLFFLATKETGKNRKRDLFICGFWISSV